MSQTRFAHSLALLLALASASSFLACEAPPQDVFRADGGVSPDPHGVMRGTVVYAGPRVPCDWTLDDTYLDEDRVPSVRGRVILTLFDARNPPPPEGSATSAVNLLALDGAELFGTEPTRLRDVCQPLHPTGTEGPATGSAPFVWPDLELGRSYQIRAFYDSDEDFSPFFSVRNSPTAGDVGGGALVDPTSPVVRYQPITFGPVAEHLRGQELTGVTVSLGAVVTTERPAFRYEGTGTFSSQALLPTTADTTAADAELWDLTMSKLTLLSDADPGLSAAFEAGGVQVDFANRYANQWYVRDVDVSNNTTGAPGADGVADPHPILGRTRSVKWVTPIILMTRAQTEAEVRAHIPTVLLIPSVRPAIVLLGNTRAMYPSLPISIAPVGVVVLDPTLPQCRVPFVPPGNQRELYSPDDGSVPGGIPTDCQEVPTGEYTINVLHGVVRGRRAGGQACADASMCDQDESLVSGIVRCTAGACAISESQSGVDLLSGLFSSQTWTLPNDLGAPDVFYNRYARNQLDPLPAGGGALPTQPGPGSLLLASQSPSARFFVFDPDDGNPGHQYDAAARRDVRAPACESAVPAAGGEALPFTPLAVPAECCAAVASLCHLPLCPLATLPGRTERSRFLTSANLDAAGKPSCVPFAIPASCCP